LRDTFQALFVKEMGEYSTALVMTADAPKLDQLKDRHVVEINHQFHDDCIQRQMDIEIHIAPQLAAVLDNLTSAVAALFSKARQERLTKLNGIRAQVHGKAEAAMRAVQIRFVEKAQIEIQNLSDGQVSLYVQQLITKTKQYGDEAIGDFRGRLTEDEWRHIHDEEANFQRKLCEPISAKLQESIRRQENVGQNQYGRLQCEKDELAGKLTAAEEQSRVQRTAMDQERAALVAAKDRAVSDAKAQAKVELDRLRNEKAGELQQTKEQFQTQIQQLQQQLNAKDSTIRSERQASAAKDTAAARQNEEIKRLRAKLRLLLAYKPGSSSWGMPTEDVLDFCISGMNSSQLDSVTLTDGNRLVSGSGDYFTLHFQGTGQRFGRDARPCVEIDGDRVAFRYGTTTTRYYATPSCPDILDSSPRFPNYSFFVPERESDDGWGGCWMLRNAGWYSRNYLRCAGGKIACDGRDSSDASRFQLVPSPS
jgi:hypothetical protein